VVAGNATSRAKSLKSKAPLACSHRTVRAAAREDHVLGLSVWKLAIIGGIIVLLFGKGKISGMMGDLAQGIKSFKKGMAEDDSASKAIDQKQVEAAAATEKST
jgi:sec-independent protein translocase protein TatA